MTNFTDLGLAEPLTQAIETMGYEKPTPIQAAVIPAFLDGRDVIGIAQTGTGKTAAYVLPMLHALEERPSRPSPKRCRVLILAPTRELAGQIADSIRSHGRHIRHSVALVVGGARPGPQIKAMARGVDFLVATPGRLMDHMETGVLSLDDVEMVALDEADQMLDMGFLPPIRHILGAIKGKRQTVLLSATMPRQIRQLANEFLHKPAEVSVSEGAKPIERIDQHVLHIEAGAKRRVLTDILRDPGLERAIVFTRTKRGADKVQLHLEKAGLRAEAIHGNRSQSQRDRTLSRFKGGRVNVLVATDVAARGIDVDDVSHVINFELPNVPESYVHRIGRTARAGKAGVAISLCDRTERAYLRDIERLISTRIQPMDAPESTGPQEVDSGPDQRRDYDDRPPRRFESRGNDEPRRHQDGRPGSDRPQNGRPPYGNSGGDRDRNARQGGDRPPYGRPSGDRYRDDRPREDRPRDDRYQGDRPQGDRPPYGNSGDRDRNARPTGGRPQHGRPNSDRQRGDRQRDDRQQDWRRDGAPPQGRYSNENRSEDGRPPRRRPEEGSSRIGRRRHMDPRAQAPVRAEAWAEDRPQQRGPRNKEEPRGQRTGGKFAPKPGGQAVDGDGGHAPMRRKGAAPAGKKPGAKAAHADGAAGRIAGKPFRKSAKTKAAASKPAGKAGRRPNKQRAAG